MEDTVLIGRGGRLSRVPFGNLQAELSGAPGFFSAKLAFMTQEHHRVRNFAVAELPRNYGKPLPPAEISRRLGLPPARVGEILEELERNLFFLVRNDAGAVNWAFPVCAEQTPHRVRFSTGEQIYAA